MMQMVSNVDYLTNLLQGSKLSSEYESDNSSVSHTQGVVKDTGINFTIMYASYLAENSERITTISDKEVREYS